MKELLFFSSQTCNPCSQVKKLLSEDIIKDLNIKFYNAEDDYEKFVEYKVQSVPTFISKENSIEKNRVYGFKTVEELKSL